MRFKRVFFLFGLGTLLLAQAAVPPLTADLVATGLYVISSAAGNTLVRLTANGLIFVDGQPERNFSALMAKARKISDQPVRVLILTHEDTLQMESDAKFVEQGAQLIAQANLAKRVPKALPFENEYTLRGGGVEVKLLHFANSHADDDTVVYFPAQRVVAVGDLLMTGKPSVDSAHAGSLAGWAAALTEILKLDFDVVVPAKGPLATRTDLEQFKLKLDALVNASTTQ